MKRIFFFALCLLAVIPLSAQSRSKQPVAKNTSAAWNTPGAGNPIIPGYFADPTVRKFDGEHPFGGYLHSLKVYDTVVDEETIRNNKL